MSKASLTVRHGYSIKTESLLQLKNQLHPYSPNVRGK